MNGSCTCTSRYIQNDISFFLNKVQIVKAKMNLNFYQISTLNIKDEYIINNQQLQHATYSYESMNQKMLMNNISTSNGLRIKFKNVIKTLNFNVSGTKGNVAPMLGSKTILSLFLSMPRQPQDILSQEVLRNPSSGINS